MARSFKAEKVLTNEFYNVDRDWLERTCGVSIDKWKYKEFAELCEREGIIFNPLELAAWVLNISVDEVWDRYLLRK